IMEIFVQVFFNNIRENNWKRAYILLKKVPIERFPEEGGKWAKIISHEFSSHLPSSEAYLSTLAFLSGNSSNVNSEKYLGKVIELSINLYEEHKSLKDALFQEPDS